MISSKKKYRRAKHTHNAALIGGSASLLLALFSPSIIAQEVKSSIDGEPEKDNSIEVIEVSGVRSSLEDALNTKRFASSIVDAISAKDLDALPALDLGEALQAIPGVQLNTDDGSRNSEITLRGLPGGFAKTTAEGQSFSTPSRSQGVVGSANPFGVFEARVFDGVTVVKSPTADLQEGGIAGIIDKKLQRALGKRDGRYSVNIGTRYEELADTFNQSFAASGSKHLIKDKLAVAFKVAGSEQNFRRDTANFTRYTPLNKIYENAPVYSTFISAEDLNAYKAANGINDPLSIINVIGRAGQVTENARGDRISATGNIEYQVTDALKLGVNFLYANRNLGESNSEEISVNIDSSDRSDEQGRNPQTDLERVTPLGAPIRLESQPNPAYDPSIHSEDLAFIPVYAIPHAELTNASLQLTNRLTSTKEEAKGIFLYADYAAGDWIIDGTISKSTADSEGVNQGLDLRHTTGRNNQRATNLDTGLNNQRFGPTGVTAVINTGNGDLQNAFTSITGFDDYVYSDVNGFFQQTDPETGERLFDLGDNSFRRFENGWRSVPLSSFSSDLDAQLNPIDINDLPEGFLPDAPAELTQEQLDLLTPDELAARTAQAEARADVLNSFLGRRVQYFVNGRVNRPNREFESGEINFQRYVDIGADAFKLTSVKFGARHSRETVEAVDSRVGAGGVNLSQINEEVLFRDGLTSDGQAEFFNGDFAGHIRSGEGWRVLDSRNLAELVQEGLNPLDPNTGEPITDFDIADPTGFPVKLDNRVNEPTFGLNELFRNNFFADQAINAVYAMGDFEGELGNIAYTGNAGVRYVETTNDVIGQGFDQDGQGIAVLVETDYEHTLPSFNISLELTDDVVLRGAFSKALVRPNLLSQTPSPRFENNGNRVILENAKAEVLPYTSNNLDFTLSWYNREGSALSIGFFKKDIDGTILTRRICPVGDNERFDIGEVELINDGTPNGLCQEIGDFEDDDGTIVTNRTVRITETFNSAIPLELTGYELAIQQNLDFLPYPWNGFGGVINFTKVEIDTNGTQTLARISPHTANIIGYYENDGFSLRLAYNWQDEKLLRSTGLGNFLGTEDRTQTSGGRLDASISYRITKKLRANVRAFNLNNREEKEFIGGNPEAISRVRFAGRIYSASLSYNF